MTEVFNPQIILTIKSSSNLDCGNGGFAVGAHGMRPSPFCSALNRQNRQQSPLPLVGTHIFQLGSDPQTDWIMQRSLT